MLSDPYKRSIYDRCHFDDFRNYFNTDSYTNFRHSFSTGNYRSSFGGSSSTYDRFNNYFKRYKDPTTFYDLYITLSLLTLIFLVFSPILIDYTVYPIGGEIRLFIVYITSLLFILF